MTNDVLLTLCCGDFDRFCFFLLSTRLPSLDCSKQKRLDERHKQLKAQGHRQRDLQRVSFLKTLVFQGHKQRGIDIKI
jgi:hypothetical protein